MTPAKELEDLLTQFDDVTFPGFVAIPADNWNAICAKLSALRELGLPVSTSTEPPLPAADARCTKCSFGKVTGTESTYCDCALGRDLKRVDERLAREEERRVKDLESRLDGLIQ
jgi:hypothetical protein